jgi:para-nitrobenzyl esterase
VLADIFGDNAGLVEQRYPLDRYDGSAPVAYSAAVTDGAFACLASRLAGDLARNAPVYAYEFNDRDAPAPGALRSMPFPTGASHALELRYLFSLGGAPPLNPAQRVLSDQMIAYWSRFVAAGNPNVPGQPDWPAIGGSGLEQRMSLQPDGSRVITTFEQTHQCPFWASLKR